MPTWIRARTVVEDCAVTKYADSCHLNRFGDAFSALKWLLARKCDDVGIHTTIDGIEYRLYRQAPDEVAKTPSIVVVYTYSPDEVKILGIKAEPAS